MANRYWVAFSSTNWNDSFNWASTSGGLGGASVPSTADDVFFDSNGPGSCSLDVNASVVSITIDAAYTGTLDAVTFDLTTSGNFTDNAGRILFGSGTWNIGGNLTLRGTSNTNCQSATINVTGNVPFNQAAANWIPGTSAWTVGGNVDAYNGSPASAVTYPNWSFTQTGTSKTAQFKNFANYTIASGASITNVRQMGCSFGTIDGTYDLNGRDFRPQYGLTVSSTGTIGNTGATNGIYFSAIPNYLTDIIVNLQGTLNLGSWFFNFELRNGRNTYRLQTAAGLELPTFNFGAGSTAGSDNWKLQIENDVIFAQDFLFYSDGSGTPGSLNNSTYNPNITFKGNATFRIAGGMNYNVGTGTITFEGTSAQSADFNGETVEALIVSDNSVNTITLADNVTTPYVHDCANQIDENGFTVTTTGTDPSPCSTGTRYWVGLVDTDYENTGNWSTSSGGLGNASVPVGSNDVVFDSGSSANCTMTNNRSMNTLNFASYAGTFAAGANSVLVVGDIDASGSTAIIDLGSSSWTVGGNYYLRFISGSSTEGTSTLRMTSTTQVGWMWKLSGGTFYSITLAPNASVVQGRNLNLTGSFILEDGSTWECGYYSPNIVTNATLLLGPNSSIPTTNGGIFTIHPDGAGSRTGHSTATIGDFSTANNNSGSLTTIPIATYTGTFRFLQNAASYHGTWRFEGDTVIEGDISTIMGKATNETIDTATNNASLTLKGDVDITPSQGTITWSAGDGTIILDNIVSQSINFNGQTVEGIHVTDASTGSIVLANNFSTAWLRDCNSLIDLNGYTITNADTQDRCVYPYDPPTTIALDSAAAINTDLKAWWPLVQTSGSSATDIGPNAFNGTQNQTEKWIVDELGYKHSFNGVSQNYFNNCGTTSDFAFASLTGICTISCWIRPTATGRSFILANNDTSGAAGFYFDRENGEDMHFYMAGPGSVTTVTTTNNDAPSDGSWQHWVLVLDLGNSVAQYYKNGATVATTSTLGSVGVGTATRYTTALGGLSSVPGETFDGDLQNVRVWSRALTSVEVASLYSDPWIGSDYTAVVPLSNVFSRPVTFTRLG